MVIRRVARIEQMDAQGNVAPPGRALPGPPSTLLKISHKDRTKSIIKKVQYVQAYYVHEVNCDWSSCI